MASKAWGVARSKRELQSTLCLVAAAAADARPPIPGFNEPIRRVPDFEILSEEESGYVYRVDVR